MSAARDAALGLFREGRWGEAEQSLEACLAATPDDADALRALAQLRFMAGRLPEALSLMDRLLARQPADAAALNSRGAILTALGRAAEALESLDAALRHDPSLVRAQTNRAVALTALGREAEALDAAEAALAHDPDHAGARAAHGMALLALGRAAEAVPALRSALAADAANLAARLDLAAALTATDQGAEAVEILAPMLAAPTAPRPALLLGLRALHGAGRYADCLALCRRMIEADPRDAEAAFGEGNALAALGDHAAALAAFDRAAALRPDDPDAHDNRGHALAALGRHSEALAAFDRALALDPVRAGTQGQRGASLIALERLEDALAALDRALALDPANETLRSLRAHLLVDLDRPGPAAEAFEDLVRRAPGTPHLRTMLLGVRRGLCDWRDEARLIDGLAQDVIADPRSVQPWTLLGLLDSPEAQLAAARARAAQLAPRDAAPLWRGERYDHARIRVAYLSTDFRDHAVGHLAAALFERHDRARFDTIAIALGGPARRGDALRPRLEAAFDRFVVAGAEDDRALARIIRDMEVDILVDLNGPTRGGRGGILDHRPAPVQAGFLGFAASSGAAETDYIIADPVVIPRADHGFYTERVVTLPDTYLPADDRRAIGPAPSRAAAGLPAEGFVFCSFNGRHKIGPAMFDIWMRLLGAVPGSVLWLTDGPSAAMDNLRREAVQRGVAPDRLVFAPAWPMDAHLARHACADLFLDTLPYNAHTTASDALWAGLPVLTAPGRTFAARVAASLLTALDMPELIMPSLAEYEATALALVRDPARIAAIRARLASQRRTAPAFDTDRFRLHLEAAFSTMHDRARRGLPPEAFAVPPLSQRAGS